MINVEQTIISQYANSPRIVQLVQNMNQYLDQTANFQAFYDYVWNVSTAQDFGLDVWGKIVGVGRLLKIPGTRQYFGFNPGNKPFGWGVFYTGANVTDTVSLTDDNYRILIMAKALANISMTSSPAINQLLQNLFPGRGRAYVSDIGNMMMLYRFEFLLQPWELAVVTQSGVLPHTSGVGAFVVQGDLTRYTGFKNGVRDPKPMNFGPFFSTDYIEKMA